MAEYLLLLTPVALFVLSCIITYTSHYLYKVVVGYKTKQNPIKRAVNTFKSKYN